MPLGSGSSAGSLPPASIYATWFENLELRDIEDGSLLDLTPATEITIRLKDPFSKFDELTLTLTNGDIVVPAFGVIEWTVSQSAMGTLRPKLYQCIITVQFTNPENTVMAFNGPISITE